jgi:CheY-like chemotaxis protein
MALQAAPYNPSKFASLDRYSQPLVLCVDDNEAILEVLSEILSWHGYRVKCEADPRRACQWVRLMNVDAVVVDYDMPGLNGSELARMVRREKPQVPILMFSGTVLDGGALDAVSAFVSKNQGVEALIDALRINLADG